MNGGAVSAGESLCGSFAFLCEGFQERISSDPGLKVRPLRNPVKTSKPGRAYRTIAGVPTGVARFNGYLVIGNFWDRVYYKRAIQERLHASVGSG